MCTQTMLHLKAYLPQTALTNVYGSIGVCTYWTLLSVYITGVDGTMWLWIPLLVRDGLTEMMQVRERMTVSPKYFRHLWTTGNPDKLMRNLFYQDATFRGEGVGWCGRPCHTSRKRITHIKILYWIFSLCHPLLYNLCTSFTTPYLIIYVLYHFCVRTWFCIHLARSMSTADSLIVMILKWVKSWEEGTSVKPGLPWRSITASSKPHTFTLMVILVCKTSLSLNESQFYMNQGVIWWHISLAGYFIFMSQGE